jgi:hypothetical protein
MILNIFANVIILLGITILALKVFKKENNNIMNKLPIYEVLYLKTSILFILSGSLSNLIMSYNPKFSQIILNIGFGMLLSWSLFFYLKYLIKKEK